MNYYNILVKILETRITETHEYMFIYSFMESLIEKYGYWRSIKEVGYAHDYELVSRWKNEKYNFTEQFTVNYNLSFSKNNPKLIYDFYNDQ